MRRLAIFLAIVSLFAFGFGFGVSAQSSPPREGRALKVEDRGSSFRQVRRAVMGARGGGGIRLCSTITPNSDVSKLIDCLNKVTKFAKDTNKFIRLFINCTQFSRLTSRGVFNGSSGYVFDLGTGTTTNLTAVDQAQPGDEFRNAYVLKDSDRCVAFT